MSTHVASVIQAYEQRIEKMELEKAVLHEKISNCGRKVGSFDESFRTALEFLSNPCHMWASEQVEYKRAVIKLAFSDSLVFDRKSGFRTAAISMPFRVLEALDNHDSIMAEKAGFEPAVRCRTHAFQACALNHSAISPFTKNLFHLLQGRKG